MGFHFLEFVPTMLHFDITQEKLEFDWNIRFSFLIGSTENVVCSGWRVCSGTANRGYCKAGFKDTLKW